MAKLLPHVWEAVSVCARLDAGVSEIPAWSFLDAIPMATRCGALDAVALADFSTAKTKTNAIAPQCVGGMGLQGALAQKGMTVVAENPIEAAEVQLAILKVLRSARVRSRCKFGGRTSRLAHNANPPRKALALSPLRQCGGGVWSLATLPPPITVVVGLQRGEKAFHDVCHVTSPLLLAVAL